MHVCCCLFTPGLLNEAAENPLLAVGPEVLDSSGSRSAAETGVSAEEDMGKPRVG